MDGTANDMPDEYAKLARGFPTILFVPAYGEQNEPIKYEGARSEWALKNFVYKQARIPIKGTKQGKGGSARKASGAGRRHRRDL